MQASDAFDDFVALVLPHTSQLPVVTMEIGDTWIQGASADPKKMAWFRAMSRARASCTQAQASAAASQTAKQAAAPHGVGVGCDPPLGSAAFRDFDRLLIKAGEHTWGWDGNNIKSEAWSNNELRASLANGTYVASFGPCYQFEWVWERSVTSSSKLVRPSLRRCTL